MIPRPQPMPLRRRAVACSKRQQHDAGPDEAVERQSSGARADLDAVARGDKPSAQHRAAPVPQATPVSVADDAEAACWCRCHLKSSAMPAAAT